MSTTNLKECCICGTNRFSKPYLDVVGKEDAATLLKCKRCELVYVNESVRKNRRFMFDGASGSLEEQWINQFPDALDVYDEKSWGKNIQNELDVARWQLSEVSQYFGFVSKGGKGTLMELGAARGNLLRLLRRDNDRLKLIAVEPSPIMAQKIREINDVRVVNGIAEDFIEPEASLDGVIAFGTFIQVRQPLETLVHLHKMMKPGSRILIDSPNDESIMRAILRIGWKLNTRISPGRRSKYLERYLSIAYNSGRFFYYTVRTYIRLLNKAGFETVEVKQRNPRYLVYKMGRKGLTESLARCMTIAEKKLKKQSWIQIVGEKR